SASRKASNSQRASAMPRLRAAETPPLACRIRRMRVSPSAATCSGPASVDPSSTTTSSQSLNVCACTLAILESTRFSLLYRGMMMLICAADLWCGSTDIGQFHQNRLQQVLRHIGNSQLHGSLPGCLLQRHHSVSICNQLGNLLGHLRHAVLGDVAVNTMLYKSNFRAVIDPTWRYHRQANCHGIKNIQSGNAGNRQTTGSGQRYKFVPTMQRPQQCKPACVSLLQHGNSVTPTNNQNPCTRYLLAQCLAKLKNPLRPLAGIPAAQKRNTG